MESSSNKRGYECTQEDADHFSEPKKQRVPALASVIVEAVKVDSLQRLCSSLEPLFRRVVSEEVERALSRLGHTKLTSRSSPPKIESPNGRNLQLHFKTRMPPHLFTGGKVEGEQGAAIHVVLLHASTGKIVQTGEESAAKLNIVVLEGDFNEEADEDWTREHFESYEVKEREGKRPLLTGDIQVTLKEGVGTLGDLTFTDNSSWIRSRKFRLGVKVAPGYCEGIHIREAKSEAFAVKDHRGELYKKHYPPALHDEVWRLDRIAKDGALHKKLLQANIFTVEDFLRLLVKDPQKLRSILGSGMSNRMWENTVDHAKTCVLRGKIYVYYMDETHTTGLIFNHIYEFRGLIADGQFLSLESLNHTQKISVDTMVKTAYENWHRVVEYDGKVLNCLSQNKKETKVLPAPKVDNHNNGDNFAMATQNQQQQHTIQPRPSPQCQSQNNNTSVPQLIEFPFVRSDKRATMPPNNHSAALTPNMDCMSVANFGVPGSYYGGEWSSPGRNVQGLEDIFAEEIRVRSSEMLERDDMQRLLKTFGVGHTEDVCYSYNVPYESQIDTTESQDKSRGAGKAVVGWLKLKAALRWGIFVRKKAAERRPQLVELD